jgi:hypothetical protein
MLIFKLFSFFGLGVNGDDFFYNEWSSALILMTRSLFQSQWYWTFLFYVVEFMHQLVHSKVWTHGDELKENGKCTTMPSNPLPLAFPFIIFTRKVFKKMVHLSIPWSHPVVYYSWSGNGDSEQSHAGNWSIYQYHALIALSFHESDFHPKKEREIHSSCKNYWNISDNSLSECCLIASSEWLVEKHHYCLIRVYVVIL